MSCKRSWALGLLAAMSILTLQGCCFFRPKPCPQTMVSLDQLLDEYNANASAVPQLWARARVKITMPKAGIPFSWGSVSPRSAPNANLLLFKGPNPLGPHNFVLIGKEAGVELFRTGTSITDGVYYFWYRWGDDAACLWGKNSLAGAPGIEGLLIDPTQIAAVLSVCELPADLTQPPLVALSMNTTPGECAYVVTYMDRQPITNKIIFKREMHFRWSDDEPRRPFRVDFFDNRGVRVMAAELSDYKPIRLANEPKTAPEPIMPTYIKITWPTENTKVEIALSEMVVDKDKGLAKVCDLWKFIPDNIPRRVQIDRNVKPQGPIQ